MMKASGRAALILMAGLFLLFGGAAQAAPSSAASSKSDSAGKQADAVQPSKHKRHDARRTSSKTAQKSTDDKASKTDAAAKTDEAKADNKADSKAGGDVPASGQMPPEVANANAQLAAADTPPAAAASAMTGRANDNVQAAADNTAAPNADSQVVAPDQLNDLDRALQQDSPPTQKQNAVIAATDAQPRPAPVMASSHQSTAWDQSSLIGKIFIGVGTLLTLASAARMFMA
ncbi:hypothetical protein [Bradyrhizobium sp. CCBAU 11361]|uniref:hypothetical protein n=1 Tax=Bradyrhizobium sp. CCBAU 11361 TaxID=1630812 RepID=UPI0023025855|nr:hypothetical protein [Bradyrhizobium sp. CCBAU 11361]MDA9488549.1 hypothetical protein [Bradyrhizobium sp. CCBAU 11361]